MSASRIIMWQIPVSFKIAMYALMFVGMGFFIKGLIDRYKFITNGKSVKELLPEKLNWNKLIETVFFTGKVTRDGQVGLFHSMIYYGFVILTIATELVAIHADTPFKVFQGTTYIVVSFLADISGVLIVIGVFLAAKRRYIDKPDYLSATNPNRERFMYAMILLLVFVGFALEGIRIAGSGMPVNERLWSPIGWIIANIVSGIGLEGEGLITAYKGLWLFHMVNTMVFLACIPFTKFMHIVYAPLSALLTPAHRGGLLNPMNFEDESAETFGLGKLSEMSMKQRLDTDACVECGRCTQVCPAGQADKPLNPKTIVTKARDVLQSKDAKENDLDFWELQTYSDVELDSCTTCGACMEECPMNIEHVQLIMDLKRYKALTLGQIPPAAATAVNNVRVNGNPWGISQEERFNWADGHDVPVAEAGKKIDYLYYVGCAGSYDASNQKVVQDTVKLLKKAGVSFAVMGKTEKCNGDPVRRFGDEYSFYEFAIENIANMRQYDFDKVVTHCPHCLHTIGKEYAKFDDGDFDTVHHTELLAELVKAGKLVPNKNVDQEMTYHDPCYLGRHHGEYDAPRSILEAVPGVKIKEMDDNKDKALCCGMGGGNMWYEIDQGKHLAENRLEQIGETSAPILATACSYCMINFNSSKGTVNTTEELQVEDIASVLAKSVID